MKENTRIWLHQIHSSRWQPRQSFDAGELYELATSIGQQGLINPVLVFRENGGYELIAGERRTRASVALVLSAALTNHSLQDWSERLAVVGLEGLNDNERETLAGEHQAIAMIEATVYPSDDLRALHLLAVTENMDRTDLSPVEEARAFQGLMDAYEWTQREMAAHVNKSQGYVAQRLGLLALPEATQQAVSTRVITFAHAREIATLPEEMQEDATGIVAAWADAGASTRVVEERLRKARKMLSPDRWTAKPSVNYSPIERNHLAMIRAAAERPGPSMTENVLNAVEEDAYVFKRNVKETIGYTNCVDSALDVLDVSLEEALAYAELSCSACIFGGAEMPCEKRPDVNAYCPRWNGIVVKEGCRKFIGRDYEIKIKAYWRVLKECLAAYKVDVRYDTYITDLDAYLMAFVEANKETEAADSPSRLDLIQKTIASYWRLQEALDQKIDSEDLEHPQANPCKECAHFCPEYLAEDMPPCAFAVNPVCDTSGYKGGQQRAPEFGVLIGKGGMMLPRCEMFSRTEGYAYIAPKYFGLDLGPSSRRRLLEWIEFIAEKVRGQSDRKCLWGILNWLPYPRKNNKPSIKAAVKYIDQNHGILGGDSGLIVLVDAARYEAAARASYSDKPFQLLNVEDGGLETWLSYNFPLEERTWVDWPEDWPKPWEMVKDEENEG